MSDTQMIIMRCKGCDIEHHVTETFYNARLGDGRSFWCPNGCKRSHRETEADRLKKRLEDTRQSLVCMKNQRDNRQHDYEDAERRRAAQQGVATKLRKKLDEVRDGE